MQVLYENRLKGKLQQGAIQNVEEMLMKEPIIEAAKDSLSYKIKTAYMNKNLERKFTTDKRQEKNVNINSTYKLNIRKNTLNTRRFEQKLQDKGQRSDKNDWDKAVTSKKSLIYDTTV
jgi:hypothetical protein